jgi:hypothetical protein
MLEMAKHKSSIEKAKLRRPRGGVYVGRRALAVPAKTKEIGLFATPSKFNCHTAMTDPKPSLLACILS